MSGHSHDTTAPRRTSARTTAVPSQAGLVQRRCACGGTPGVDGECSACRAKRLRSEQPAAPQPTTTLVVGAPGDRHEQEAEQIASGIVNRSGATAAPAPAVTPALEAQVRGLAGGGSALPPQERALFEHRFGLDFGRVRIHTDERAEQSARALQARAYTFGSDIAFGPGHYAPGTAAGRALLAHELTHVAQQTRPGAARGAHVRRSPLATSPTSRPIVQRDANTCTYGEIREWAITSLSNFAAPAGLGDAKASIGAVCSPANCNCVDGSRATAPGDRHAWTNIQAAAGTNQSGGGDHMCVGSEACGFVHECTGCTGTRATTGARATALTATGTVTVAGRGTLYFYSVPFQGWCSAEERRTACRPQQPPPRRRRSAIEPSDTTTTRAVAAAPEPMSAESA